MYILGTKANTGIYTGKGEFFSIQVDGSCNSANLEQELFIALYFDPYTSDGKVHVCSKFLSVRQPTSANAAGLFEAFTRAISRVDITNFNPPTAVSTYLRKAEGPLQNKFIINKTLGRAQDPRANGAWLS